MKNKKVISILMAAAMLAMSAACGTTKPAENNTAVSAEAEKTQKAETKAEDSEENCVLAGITKKEYESMTAQDLVDRIKDVTNITDEEMTALFATYAYVAYDENYLWKDSITSEAMQLIRDNGGSLSYSNDVIDALIKSDNPGARAYGFSCMGSYFGTTDAQNSIAVEVLANENAPIVCVNALQSLNKNASIPEIAQFFLRMAEHEDPVVRKYAAEAIGDPASAGVTGMTDAIIKLMGDENEEVKKSACTHAGNLGDERVVESLTTILNDEHQIDIHEACVEGLVNMWYDGSTFEHNSEAAYRACLSYWAKTPRTSEEPSANNFNMLSSKSSAQNDRYETWKQQATYFNPEELGNVMLDIVKDENAAWMTRVCAAKVILIHCGDTQKSELQNVIDGLSGSDADLIRSNYEQFLTTL